MRWKDRVAFVAFAALPALAQNQPPATPVVTEPQVGRLVNFDDVHMECEPFADPNPGDTHVCTDWEIWTITPPERVWFTSCIGGVERLHTHQADGVFQGSHAGRRTFFPDTAYQLRVRHRDSSADPLTEWSAFGTRDFTTGPQSTVFALELDDILNVPAPTFRETSGANIALPAGANPAIVRVETATGDLLLQFRGASGGVQTTNPAPLAQHGDVRVVFSAGSAALNLPESDIAFRSHEGTDYQLVLPGVTLAPSESAYFWISSNGSSYVGDASQTTPNFGTLARGVAVPWTVIPGFRVEVVARGFQLPVAIAFVPNPGSSPTSPLYYVGELYGAIKVVLRNGEVRDYATNLLNFNPTGNFPGSGEQGLGGLAVDPLNGDLYITILYSAIPGQEAAPHYPAVERFTSLDGGITAATRTRILNMAPETQGQSHQISNITFGPDNQLYVHMGDGFDASTAQNLDQFRGKVLRINRAGNPISSNPFYNASSITPRDYVYAYGYRNPFGGAWRFSDGNHFIVENGPSVDRFSMLVAGRNMGWTGTDASMQTFALYNWNPATAPVNAAVVEPAQFAGSGFPADLHGRIYVTQSCSTFGLGPGSPSCKSITEWVISSAGVLTSGPRAICYYNGSGASTAAALATGPDGLYFSDLYEESGQNPIARGANILRLKWIGLPPPPDCNTNGIPDRDDLANGTSLDCNGNAIPDECDLLTGRSLDCNRNGIPDECEVGTTLAYDFAGGSAAPFQLNGVAVPDSGAIRLTPASGNQLGSMVHPPLLAVPMTNFAVAFDFRIGGGSGADGLSFAAFDQALYPATTLWGEEGPGSQSHTPGGPGTLVVQFDTWDNGGEGENTIEIASNGVTIARASPSFDMEDDLWHRAEIVFDGEHLTVRVNTIPGAFQVVHNAVEIPNYSPFIARMGFGGRTGGATNNHWIDNVSFVVPGGPNDQNQNGVPDACENCVADVDDGTFTGTPDFGVTIDDLLYYLFIFEEGSVAADVDDGTSTGTPDGGVTIDDLLYFLQRFEAGC